jgi:hypothetical protein
MEDAVIVPEKKGDRKAWARIVGSPSLSLRCEARSRPRPERVDPACTVTFSGSVLSACEKDEIGGSSAIVLQDQKVPIVIVIIQRGQRRPLVVPLPVIARRNVRERTVEFCHSRAWKNVYPVARSIRPSLLQSAAADPARFVQIACAAASVTFWNIRCVGSSAGVRKVGVFSEGRVVHHEDIIITVGVDVEKRTVRVAADRVLVTSTLVKWIEPAAV